MRFMSCRSRAIVQLPVEAVEKQAGVKRGLHFPVGEIQARRVIRIAGKRGVFRLEHQGVQGRLVQVERVLGSLRPEIHVDQGRSPFTYIPSSPPVLGRPLLPRRARTGYPDHRFPKKTAAGGVAHV